MKIVILAAGYATRLYPLTKDKPKALLPIGKKPLLNHLMDKTRKLPGCDEVVLVTNSRFSAQFEAWAKELNFPVPVSVIDDGTDSNDNRLGAIGDLQFALKQRGISDDLLVLASDNLFEEGLSGFLTAATSKGASASVGVYDIGDRSMAANRYGVIEFDGKREITRIEEKPAQPRSSFVSTGVYYFSKETLEWVDKYMASDEKQDAPGHYVTWLLGKVPVFAYQVTGKWFDIGSLDQLEEASKEYPAEEE